MGNIRDWNSEVLEDVLEIAETQGKFITQYYLRIENNTFGFLVEELHEIKETDILITNDDYNTFFELQSQGKQFRVKQIPTGETLFDYIEEYILEVIEEVLEQGIDEFMLETDFRLSKLELGV